MKYSIVVTKVVKSTKTFEIEAEGLDAMYKTEDADEVRNLANIEAINDDFSDAETTIEYVMGGIQEVEENPYIDQYGNPYDSESEDACWPAGGGLHKDCEFNADALYAYYTLGDRDKIEKYLRSKGFKRVVLGEHEEVWTKGNTEITYEDYDYSGSLWGYMHTELIEG